MVSVGELDCPIPSRLELQNWVDLRWKTAGGEGGGHEREVFPV